MPPPRCTVLLVDDNALTRMSAARMLTDLGHTVIEARSGAEAIAALRADSGIDLVITDQVMPGMTGTQLAAEIRSALPHLPVVVSSGYVEQPDDGSDALPRLDKPYDLEDLTAMIARLVPDVEP
jgi:CheY-like chemotaxis protein